MRQIFFYVHRLSLALTLAAILSHVGSAHSAGSVAVSPRYLARLADHALTVSLENELAEALKSERASALKTLSARVERKDGISVEALLNGSPHTQLETVAHKLSPCHYSGIYLRVLIVGAAEGRIKASQQDGRYLFDEASGVDDKYVENIRRCERVYRHQKTERKIGTTCLIDGQNCREP